MQHAEAHERLADLALEPGRLTRLDTDPSPGAAELRRHVAGCERCAADLAGWRQTWAEVDRLLPGSGARPDPIGLVSAPPALREQTLTAARAERERARGGAPAGGRSVSVLPAHRPRGRQALPWMVAAAALIVAVAGGAFGWSQSREVDQLRARTARLETVAATFERVLASEKHWTITLRTADGTAGGTLAWSSAEIVMVTTGLPRPGPGQAYRCWVEVNGVRTRMGTLAFSGATGYWTDGMYSWAEAIGPGARYGVSLVPDGGQGTPVLIGSL